MARGRSQRRSTAAAAAVPVVGFISSHLMGLLLFSSLLFPTGLLLYCLVYSHFHHLISSTV
uniref:Uncharacterized protein n=1 Tax=Oryza rufipogon TaxID=4529 RepID=A0A0E0RKK0_ORYRU